MRAQKELVLLHKEDAETPKNTAEWLNLRGWLSSHHHLRCPKRVLRLKSMAKIVSDLFYTLLFPNLVDAHNKKLSSRVSDIKLSHGVI